MTQKNRKNTKKNTTNENSENIEQKLQSKLLRKLSNFVSTINPESVLDESLISEYHSENEQIACKFECPICGKKIKCVHIKYWIVSNFECHFKKHFTFETVSAETAIEGISVMSYGDENISELDEILGN